MIINAICVTIVLGFFFLYILFCEHFLGAINFNVYQFTTDTVYMYIYQKCKFGLIAVKSIIFQVMLNFIISIHVYTYYKIKWVPLNLIAVKQICCIFHITLKYNYTYNYVLHVHKVIEIVVV